MAAKILIVEDEPDIVSTTKMALEASGYEVAVAADGLAALFAVAKENPALIILDMMLPKLNGEQVVDELKKNPGYKDIPIILITALSQRNEKEVMCRMDVDFCLVKPFDLDELCILVRRLTGS